MREDMKEIEDGGKDNAGKGALRVEGKMAERLHLAQAERLVAVAAAIAARAA